MTDTIGIPSPLLQNGICISYLLQVLSANNLNFSSNEESPWLMGAVLPLDA